MSLSSVIKLSYGASWHTLRDLDLVSLIGNELSLDQISLLLTFLEDIPYINVPLHTLIVVKSYGYDFQIETVPLKGKLLSNLSIKIQCKLIWMNEPLKQSFA